MDHIARDRTTRRVRRHDGVQHLSLVALEIADRLREFVRGYSERGRKDLRLVPVALPVRFGEPAGDELEPTQRGQHQCGLDPQKQLRIPGAVMAPVRSLAADPSMALVDAPHRPLCALRVTEDRVERGVHRAVQPSEWVAAEVGMLVNTGRHQRMRDLQEQRGTATEDDEELAVQSPRDRIAREDADVRHTRSVSLLRSFGFALEGVSYLIRTQRSAQIEIAIGAAVIALAAWLRITALEWAVLILAMALVLALEALNTAVELAVTLASPERHPLAKAAKDVSAAMVLIAAIASVVVGLTILGPRLV